MDWIRFFFGTPTRLFAWLVIAGLITVVIAPGFLAMAFNRLLSEVFNPLATLALIYLAYRVIFRGLIESLGGGGGRRRRR